MFRDIGELVILFWRTLLALPLAFRQRRKVAEQFYEVGMASLLMVCILSVFIGGVLALEIGPVMVERGLANYLGGILGLGICRELAPTLMAVLIAGRIGSAKAAEIGSMAVYVEIEALRPMPRGPPMVANPWWQDTVPMTRAKAKVLMSPWATSCMPTVSRRFAK